MQKLRFLHIPKTAGTTFTGVLLRQYIGRKNFELTWDMNRYAALPPEERGRCRLFFGHAPIITGDAEIDALPVITFLREPVSRVISFCQHVAEGKSPYLREEFPPSAFDLDRFLDSGNYELSNLQTKMLLDNFTSAEFQEGNVTETRASEIAFDMLVNRVTAFGLQEYFDASLMIFSVRFNWWLPLYPPNKRSVSAHKLTFEQRHLDKIREINSADIKLYAAAKEKFLQQLGCSTSIKARLRRFQVMNALVGNITVKTVERILSGLRPKQVVVSKGQ